MKYMGSKNRIGKDLMKVMVDNNKFKMEETNFIDLFCGGLNLIQYAPKKFKRIVANDNNPFLISMWHLLLKDSYTFPSKIEKDLYNEYRDKYNKLKNNSLKRSILNDCPSDMVEEYALIGWIGFMASFNGRFFSGGYSGHKVGSRDYITESINNVKKQIPLLDKVILSNYSYKDFPLINNSIVYCDIPYLGKKNYGLSFDYEEFYSWCQEVIRKHNIQLYISEYEMPSDRFECIWEKEVTTALNQRNTQTPIEKLFIPNI